jgi:ADP-dependent NAD(P)H-hydrate dehydratase
MSGPAPVPALPPIPPRPREAHKGSFGTVAVIGGSNDAGEQMIGAPAFTALAALRAGAGLVRLVMPGPLLSSGLLICPGATGMSIPVSGDASARPGEVEPHEAAATIDRVIDRADVLAIGPGLGVSAGAQAAVLRVIQQDHLPVVLDADALNCLSHIAEFRLDFRATCVLTPHPGEFRRLCQAMGISNNLGLDRSREDACQQLAQRLGAIVVLKGAGTVVSDGLSVWTCTSGHPCLATAGTGDVLTGVIAALIAQFCPSLQTLLFRSKVPAMPVDPARPLSLLHAACLGVLVHARAGEAWARSRNASGGLLASELADLLPSVLETLRGQSPPTPNR